MAETNPTTKTCRTCGREMSALRRGFCANCYRIWQRDNAPPNATCEVCGREYFRRSSASPSGRTCSRECYATWKRGRDQHNQPTNGATLVERVCEWCGCAFTVEQRQVDKGLGRFCSLRCNGARRATPRLFIACERCGRAFEFLPNRVFLAGGRFCSRRCYQATRHEERLSPEGDRGRTYRSFRDGWIAKQETCERCGSRHDLLVHHRIRSRERPDLLFDPLNLEVLCRSCHTRCHGELGHMRVPEVAHELAN